MLFLNIFVLAQSDKSSVKVIIISKAGKNRVCTNKEGEILLRVSIQNIKKFKKNGLVHYSDLGAKGDGKTDDMDAIVATHAFANKYKLSVKADSRHTYYISGKSRSAIIKTDTDFGTANFIIDDTNVQNIKTNVFMVKSELIPFDINGIYTLKKIKKN